MSAWLPFGFTEIFKPSGNFHSATSAAVTLSTEMNSMATMCPRKQPLTHAIESPLKLRTHVACNSAQKEDDKKVGRHSRVAGNRPVRRGTRHCRSFITEI